jgi:anti-sigma regulatory factor (Ser/Thr protein kinase)
VHDAATSSADSRKAEMPALTPTASGLRTARDDARTLCRQHDIAVERGDDFVLIVSELVSNAITHGSPPSSYDVSLDKGDLFITVDDTNPNVPSTLTPVADGSEGGRGLGIVEALARLWGWLPTAGGKRVWARV